MITSSESFDEEQVRHILGQMTEKGAYWSKPEGSEALLTLLSPRAIDDIIESLPGDSSTVRARLLGTSPLRLARLHDLDPEDLFKFRAQWLLGLGAARAISNNGERRQQLNSTFQHRDQTTKMSRTERDTLLKRLSLVIADSLQRQPVNQSRAAGSSQRGALITDYVVEKYEALHTFTGGMKTTLNKRLIRATVEGVSSIRLQHQMTWHGGYEPNIEMTAGGELHILRERRSSIDGVPARFIDLEIVFPTIAYGETHEVQWLRRQPVIVGDVADDDETFVGISPQVTIVEALIRVRFGERVPRKIWSVENVLPTSRDDSDGLGAVLEPSAVNEVELSVTSPEIGFWSGIVWTW